MRYDLAALARRAGNPRRRSVTLRDINPPAVLASDLFAAGYRPVIDLWRRTAERVIAEYERSLSTLTTDAPADLSAELDQAEAEMQRLVLLLRPAMRDWAVRVERYMRSKFIGAVLVATKIDLSTILSPTDVEDTVQNALEWNVSLVRDVSDQTQKRIGDAVFAGLRERTPAREVAKTIREAVGMSRRRSTLIASDQLTKLSSKLAQARAEHAGLDEYVWVHSMKKHPRESHKARDGRIYKWSEPPSDGHPGTAIFCGCRARAHLRFD